MVGKLCGLDLRVYLFERKNKKQKLFIEIQMDLEFYEKQQGVS